MASSLPFRHVELDENDVPGARLPHEEVEKNSLIQLQRFLACRNINSKGKKDIIVKRVKEAIIKAVPVYLYVDKGKWMLQKEKKKRSALLEKVNNKDRPPNFPVMWKTFPTSIIPDKFSYGNIYYYMITCCCLQSEVVSSDSDCETNRNDDWGTAKPFRKGRMLVDSNFIRNIEDSTIRNYYCLKATIFASYKKNVYLTMIMLDKNGDVVDAACNCKGSSMGRCCHVAALLLYLDDFNSKNKVPCTSQVCKWNTGGKEKNPGLIWKQYNEKHDTWERVAFDPRRSIPTAEEQKEKESALLLGLQLQSSVTSVPSRWELLLTPPYEDYNLTSARREVLLNLVSIMKENLKFDSLCPKPVTTSQTDNPHWLHYRKLLMTASIITEMHLNKTPLQLYNLLERQLYSKCVGLKLASIEHGKKYEATARQEYIMYMEKTAPGSIAVEETGLWINPSYPGLGASPDGLVVDRTTAKQCGLLEIKCPKLLEYQKPTDLSSLSKEQIKRFCCDVEDSRLVLKTNHKYFLQMQVQMGVLQREWCDFVVWTKKGIDVQRIGADPFCFTKIIEKAYPFYDNVLLPEYFEQRVPRKLMPFNLNEF